MPNARKPKVSLPRKVTDEDKVIGENIKTQRLIKGLSQDDLGKAIGVSFQQVQKYERGVNRVSSARAGQIAKFLGVHVMALIGSASDTIVKSTPFSRYIASIEGVQLIEAMLRIKAPTIRRSLIALAETLGDS